MKAVILAGGLADTGELLAHKNYILIYHLEGNLLRELPLPANDHHFAR